MRGDVFEIFVLIASPFFEERKFYASRASKVKLVLKLLALDAAKKGWLKNTRHFHVGGQHL